METGLLLAKAKETTNSAVYFHFRGGETEAWGGLPSTGGSGQLFCHLVSHPNSEVMPTSASSRAFSTASLPPSHVAAFKIFLKSAFLG